VRKAKNHGKDTVRKDHMGPGVTRDICKGVLPGRTNTKEKWGKGDRSHSPLPQHRSVPMLTKKDEKINN
jgi:hypothetical protein